MATLIRYSLAALLALLLAACVAPTWERLEGADAARQMPPDESFSLDAPSGWVRYRPPEDDNQVVLTRDGPGLQTIRAVHRPHRNGFDNLRQDSGPTMQPQRLADLFLQNRRQDKPDRDITVEKQRTLTMDGRPAFGLLLSYKTEVGLQTHELVSGQVAENGLYLVIYQAPALYYYERDRAAYEKVVDSFSIQPIGSR